MKKLLSVVLLLALLTTLFVSTAFAKDLGVQLTSSSIMYQRRQDVNKLRYRVTVWNGTNKTVKSFDMITYAVDEDGESLYGTMTYTWTTKKKIKPGDETETGNVVLPFRDRIARVYVGVKSVTYTDGTSESIDDDNDINWWWWEYEEW